MGPASPFGQYFAYTALSDARERESSIGKRSGKPADFSVTWDQRAHSVSKRLKNVDILRAGG